MKLHEIDAAKFNNLLTAEPDTNIFQSSYWADYEVDNGYKALFVEAYDEVGSCDGLGMFLLKKMSLLSNRLSAYAPHGYLINYYDDRKVEEFNDLLIPFLRDRNIAKLMKYAKILRVAKILEMYLAMGV